MTFTLATWNINSVRLREALVSGIGPAKGYGCGLITLARPT